MINKYETGDLLTLYKPIITPDGRQVEYVYSKNWSIQQDKYSAKISISVIIGNVTMFFMNAENVVSSIRVLKCPDSQDIFNVDTYSENKELIDKGKKDIEKESDNVE